jgi:MFS transporter, putative metabolite:H+ symporter
VEKLADQDWIGSGHTVAVATPASLITARLARLPATRSIWILVLLLSLGGWFEIYDMFFTAYVGPGMVKSGIFSNTTASFFGFTGLGGFVAATFAGLFLGTFFLGALSDRWGRRTVFTVALLWYTIAAVIMAFQHSAEWINIWRLIAGIGVGAEIVTIDSYIAELVPATARGRAFALQQAIQYTSIPTIAFLSWRLAPLTPFGLEGWRWVMLSSAVGAAVIWLIRLGLPESPRWLADRGRIAEAEAIVSRLEQRAVRESRQPLPEPAIQTLPPTGGRSNFLELWRPPYRRRTIMLMVFNFFQSIGYYGFASWVPTLLVAKGVTITHSLFYSFLIATANPLGPFVSLLFVERFERKWMIAGSAGLMAILGIVFSQQREILLVVGTGLLMTLVSNCMTFSYRTYQAELFPTRVRGRAVGFVYSLSRISAMFSGFMIAFSLRNFGVGGVFTLIAGSMAIVVFVITVFGPRTKGLPLEVVSR